MLLSEALGQLTQLLFNLRQVDQVNTGGKMFSRSTQYHYVHVVHLIYLLKRSS